MSSSATPEFFKVPEAARHFKVRRETVYRWIAAGKLEAFRLGEAGPLRIPADALDAHLRRVAPAAERGSMNGHPSCCG